MTELNTQEKRELTLEEINEVNGGIVPVAYALYAIAGGSAASLGFRLGNALGKALASDADQ